MKRLDAQSVIDLLKLTPHVEGGAFRETYRASTKADSSRPRDASTLIYFLLKQAEVSAWHRVNGSDEIFLYHGGDPYQLRWIDSQGRFNDEPVGMDMENGEQPQRTVPSGCWQAAFPKRGGEYGWSLVACMVTPGFDFDDFELASQERIAGLYPNLIDKLSLSI